MQTKIKGAPDYDQAEFWDTKFATGQDVGEWLNSGEALLEAVLRTLEGKPRQHEMKPSVLHLGPGISKLGSKLCEEFARRGWSGSGIVVSLKDNEINEIKKKVAKEHLQLTPGHILLLLL